ncbi:MAG: thymidine phosphorylase [Clostridia bacterium]
MTIFDILDKKRKGFELSSEEIQYFVNGFVAGNIEEAQMSALLMAICINGMNRKEVLCLTQTMATSGNVINLSSLYENGENLCVDKHSSGGVSDTTTFVIAGILASAGVKMVKMSGKSLGFTGGTADKVASFTGYQNEKTIDEAIYIAKKCNVSLITQSVSIVPADKKIYSLRDRTGTVQSIPLIASSIMSKKIASGSGILLLDVKCGNGAFMENLKEAQLLAETMVKLGNDAGIKTAAFVTDMNEPLGATVGNVLEAREAVQILKNEKEGRLKDLCVEESAWLISEAKKISIEQAKIIAFNNIQNGKAYSSFKKIVEAHSGIIPDFKVSDYVVNVLSDENGFVSEFKTRKIGELARFINESCYNGGLEFFVKLGSKVKKGDLLAKIYVSKELNSTKISDELKDLIVISSKTKKHKLIYKIITK